jgi:hypothetical protein
MVERNRHGALIGRVLSGWHDRYMPPGTRRGQAMGLALRVLVSLYRQGWAKTFKYSWGYLLARFCGQSAPTAALPGERHATPPDYDHWIKGHEPTATQLAKQRERVESLASHPLISVILPVYKVPGPILAAAVQSLRRQTYPHWEVCVAYADVDNEENWALLNDMAATDARIRLKRLEANAGISGNTDVAFAMARGEFVALLDHDDELTPWALFDMATRIVEDDQIDFLYSDKDCLDEAGGVRLNPLVKPAWSPEMLYSVNYLTHLCVMRRSLVEAVGGWNKETDGAQDWDIFLRVTERSRKIAGVPAVIYHWRIISTSVAMIRLL